MLFTREMVVRVNQCKALGLEWTMQIVDVIAFSCYAVLPVTLTGSYFSFVWLKDIRHFKLKVNES